MQGAQVRMAAIAETSVVIVAALERLQHVPIRTMAVTLTRAAATSVAHAATPTAIPAVIRTTVPSVHLHVAAARLAAVRLVVDTQVAAPSVAAAVVTQVAVRLADADNIS